MAASAQLTRRRLIKEHAGVGGLALQDVPLPAVGENDVLLKVRQAAICGTDLHLYNWNQWASRNYQLPLPMGHEFAGVVEQVGERVTNIKVGQHVAGETHLFCGACRQCRSNRRHTCNNLRLFSKLGLGCFSETMVVPAEVLRPLPDELPFHRAAVMEPFGVGVRAAMEADLRGRNVLVTGCGPIGLYTIVAARQLGAAAVIAADISPYRRDLALAVGAADVIDPSKSPLTDTVRAWTQGEGIDVAIDASGNAKAIQESLAAVTTGGTLVFAGVPNGPIEIDVARHVINREVVLRGMYGRLIDETWLVAERLMMSAGADVDTILTHTLPLAAFQEAFDLAVSGNAGKVTFEFAN